MVQGKESINLTTFGRYRFRRMPFSLRMSQEVFETKMDQTFEGKWLDLPVARMNMVFTVAVFTIFTVAES